MAMTVLMAKLTDPVLILIALIGAAMFRRAWMVLIVALIAIVVQSFVLLQMGAGRSFSPQFFVIGYVAALIWACIGYFLVRRLFVRRSTDESKAG